MTPNSFHNHSKANCGNMLPGQHASTSKWFRPIFHILHKLNHPSLTIILTIKDRSVSKFSFLTVTLHQCWLREKAAADSNDGGKV